MASETFQISIAIATASLRHFNLSICAEHIVLEADDLAPELFHLYVSPPVGFHMLLLLLLLLLLSHSVVSDSATP